MKQGDFWIYKDAGSRMTNARLICERKDPSSTLVGIIELDNILSKPSFGGMGDPAQKGLFSFGDRSEQTVDVSIDPLGTPTDPAMVGRVAKWTENDIRLEILNAKTGIVVTLPKGSSIQKTGPASLKISSSDASFGIPEVHPGGYSMTLTSVSECELHVNFEKRGKRTYDRDDKEESTRVHYQF